MSDSYQAYSLSFLHKILFSNWLWSGPLLQMQVLLIHLVVSQNVNLKKKVNMTLANVLSELKNTKLLQIFLLSKINSLDLNDFSSSQNKTTAPDNSGPEEKKIMLAPGGCYYPLLFFTIVPLKMTMGIQKFK